MQRVESVGLATVDEREVLREAAQESRAPWVLRTRSRVGRLGGTGVIENQEKSPVCEI